MNKTRLEAFSDGVFAIVITLLILNVRVPDGRTLTFQSLQPLVPALATFVLSFIMVGVYWIAHHHMLHFIKQVNRRLLWLNLLVLLCVVFIGMGATVLAVVQGSPAKGRESNGFHDAIGTCAPILLFMALVLLLGIIVPPPVESLLREAAAFLESKP